MLTGVQRVPRQMNQANTPWKGRRAQSSGSGIRGNSSAFTAMWTLAGKIATTVASSHQRAIRRVRAGSAASPPAISAAPLAATTSPCQPTR